MSERFMVWLDSVRRRLSRWRFRRPARPGAGFQTRVDAREAP